MTDETTTYAVGWVTLRVRVPVDERGPDLAVADADIVLALAARRARLALDEVDGAELDVEQVDVPELVEYDEEDILL